MPLADRDYMREAHPPACTCVSCIRERMRGSEFTFENKKLAEMEYMELTRRGYKLSRIRHKLFSKNYTFTIK